MALSEIADSRDEAIVRAAVADPRPRVRGPALRGLALCGLALIDPAAAVEAALVELVSGSSGATSRVAANVLRSHRLGEAQLRSIERCALDPSAPPGRRSRALSILRPARWQHLAVVLQVRASAPPPLADVSARELDLWLKRSSGVARGPDSARRAAIESRLGDLDEARRRSIEFVLRTTS